LAEELISYFDKNMVTYVAERERLFWNARWFVEAVGCQILLWVGQRTGCCFLD